MPEGTTLQDTEWRLLPIVGLSVVFIGIGQLAKPGSGQIAEWHVLDAANGKNTDVTNFASQDSEPPDLFSFYLTQSIY